MLFMDDSLRIRAVCLHCREKPDVSPESKQANDNSVKLRNSPQERNFFFFFLNSGAPVCVGLCFDPEHLQPYFSFSLCMQDTDYFSRSWAANSMHQGWLMYYSWAHSLWQWWVVNSTACVHFLGWTLKRLCRPGRVQRFRVEIFIFQESCLTLPRA